MSRQEDGKPPVLTGKIKICGLKRPEDIAYANACMPDYIGFVFAGKKRKVTLSQAASLREGLKPGIVPVGVFVNEELSVIRQAVEEGIIQMVQLHGQETQEEILALREMVRVPIIKAVSVKNVDSIQEAQKLSCDYLLLDHGAGGTGERFSWEMLRELEEGLGKPFFLAGGLDIHNIREARKYGAFCLDVSSGAETEGFKDYEKMKALVEAVRKD